MKKLIACVLVASMAVALAGCASNKEICGTTYKPYGFFNMDDKNPNVEYDVSAGNIVWGIILFETIAVPVILWGWYLWEPTHSKDPAHRPGVVGSTSAGLNCPT